ncbi:DUF2017 family protein [Saccharothrix syringae]|nr:DUF2017 family protein [Saccharothrix syringae]
MIPITADYFDAAPVPDGVLVRMAANVEDTLAHQITGLIGFLQAPAVTRAQARLHRRVFPDAYRSRAAARDFRGRHAADLHDTAAAERVLARCRERSPFVLDRSELQDWLSTVGLLRLLDEPRRGGRRSVSGAWYGHIQDSLVLAADPGLATGWDRL